MLNKPIYVTEKGKEKLEEELKFLRTEKRLEVIDRLQDAKGGSDWMDNTEYMLIEDELAFIDGRIQELEHMLRHAEIIQEGQHSSTVELGETVVIQPLANGQDLETYTIVGVAEVDPARGFISNESPMGQALLDQKIGDEVTVKTPGGEIKYRIVAIS